MSFEIDEISIPVPWGHIAAKTWGSKKNLPILCIHGAEDNAGTFDHLIQLLPQDYYYICIDLPGHGKSSHFPPHITIKIFDWAVAVKLVFDHFNWEKCTILAHSLGSQASMVFASLYPECIEKFISLDTVTTLPIDIDAYMKYYREKISKYKTIEKKLATNNPPIYTYEEALDRTRNGRPTYLTTEAAKALLERRLVPLGNGKFRFSNDQRIKNVVREPFSTRYLTKLSKINFPHLVILARETVDIGIFNQQHVFLKEFKKNKSCIIKIVDGNHDVHNNSPEIVAPIIIKFLSKFKSKL